MKKKILSVCILLAMYLPASYAEEFYDGDCFVQILFEGFLSYKEIQNELNRQEEYAYKYVEIANKHFSGRKLELVEMRRNPKLSNHDIQHINNALSKFPVKKGEVYLIWVSDRNDYYDLHYVAVTEVYRNNICRWNAYSLRKFYTLKY